VLPFALLADHVPRGPLPVDPRSKRQPEQGALF